MGAGIAGPHVALEIPMSERPHLLLVEDEPSIRNPLQRYLEREGAPPDSQKSPALKDGDPMDSAEFPLIWTADQGYVSF